MKVGKKLGTRSVSYIAKRNVPPETNRTVTSTTQTTGLVNHAMKNRKKNPAQKDADKPHVTYRPHTLSYYQPDDEACRK
eukprot:COSAG05_NODE_1342_length_5140_cov_2.897838_2_plen_79_part_00